MNTHTSHMNTVAFVTTATAMNSRITIMVMTMDAATKSMSTTKTMDTATKAMSTIKTMGIATKTMTTITTTVTRTNEIYQ